MVRVLVLVVVKLLLLLLLLLLWCKEWALLPFLLTLCLVAVRWHCIQIQDPIRNAYHRVRLQWNTSSNRYQERSTSFALPPPIEHLHSSSRA